MSSIQGGAEQHVKSAAAVWARARAGPEPVLSHIIKKGAKALVKFVPSLPPEAFIRVRHGIGTGPEPAVRLGQDAAERTHHLCPVTAAAAAAAVTIGVVSGVRAVMTWAGGR